MKYRIIIGALTSPIALTAILQIPFIGHHAFNTWLVINLVTAYLFFLVLASISHFILSRNGWVKLWQYCIVMFALGVIADFSISIWSLSDYSSYFYEQTRVVENEYITLAGYILELKNACIHGAYLSFTMALFWLISFGKLRAKI